MPQKKKKKIISSIIATNRRARYDYEILETFEAGIILTGSEVKSLRARKSSINEAFASEKHGELYLNNAYIAEYSKATPTHEPREARKLLLHKREISKLLNSIKRKGMTVIPLSLYFNKRGLAKVQIAQAIGKQRHDKRENIKQRDWSRQKEQLLRNRN